MKCQVRSVSKVSEWNTRDPGSILTRGIIFLADFILQSSTLAVIAKIDNFVYNTKTWLLPMVHYKELSI